MSKGRFMSDYAVHYTRMGKNAFIGKYATYAMVGIGMYGDLSEGPDPFQSTGTAAIQFGNESSFVESTSLVGRAWIIKEPQYAPKGSAVRVGRDASNDLIVPEYSLSKNHCDFRLEGEQLFVTDLGSLNGTLLNGKRIPANEEVPVQAGTILVLGRFQFEIVDAIQFAARVGDFAALTKATKKSTFT